MTTLKEAIQRATIRPWEYNDGQSCPGWLYNGEFVCNALPYLRLPRGSGAGVFRDDKSLVVVIGVPVRKGKRVMIEWGYGRLEE